MRKPGTGKYFRTESVLKYADTINAALNTEREVFYIQNGPVREVLGVESFKRKYGWPIVKFNYISRANDPEKFRWHYCDKSARLPNNTQFGHHEIISYPPRVLDYKHQDTSLIQEVESRVIYKKNYKKIKKIKKKFYDLFIKCGDLDRLKIAVLYLKKTHRKMAKGGKMKAPEIEGTNELDTDSYINKTTAGVRQAVIDEINLLRKGKTSIARARAISSLASRAIESMRIDLDAQFMLAKKELLELPEIPESLNEKPQIG